MGYLRRLTSQKTIKILTELGFQEVGRSPGCVQLRALNAAEPRYVEVPIAKLCDADLLQIATSAGLPPAVFETVFDPVFYRPKVEAHELWLSRDSKRLARGYRQRCEDHPDSAVFEALTRELLLEDVDEVRPGEMGREGGPDFRCLSGTQEFEVEASVLEMETTIDAIGLSERPDPFAEYRAFNHRLRDKLDGPAKQRQFDRAKHPLLFVFGTHHASAGSTLTDSIHMEWMLCEPEHPLSVFFVRQTQCEKPVAKYKHPSAVLLFAPGVEFHGATSRRARGILNPGGVREFDSAWLPQDPFCHFRGEWDSTGPIVDWSVGCPARVIARPY